VKKICILQIILAFHDKIKISWEAIFLFICKLVLYNGEYKWTVEKKFKNVISKSELFGNNIIDFEYILIDINKSIEEVKGLRE